MTKRFISLLLMTLILGSCAPAPVSVTPPPTTTLPPTRTPRPTQTAIPTRTSYPPLQTGGPYLLFTYDNKNFTIMDADGSGRKQFQLPNDGYTTSWRLEDAVSPDGKWLAYFTGSIDEPYDLAINLLDLKNETTFPVANLIAPRFPENMEPVTKVLRFDNCSNTECKTSLFRIGLIEGIKSLEWSPDSKLLAFSAQIDSFSSDIYVFSVGDKTVARITNEPENIYRIFWSPSGEKILYDASIEGSS